MSADKIDHKAEALRLTAVAAEFDSIAAATSAVTHATLYAAEQQRVANQMTYFRDTGMVPSREIHDSILDGLGLA